jgi:N-ethylmaleimide reductase
MSSDSKLFAPVTLGKTELSCAVIMAPLTRNRCDTEGVPGSIVAEYYAQRACAGLIITEGTQPSAEGQGYARTPGCYTDAQVAGWKQVTDAVHAKGSKIFVQLMHAGRIAHPNNRTTDAQPVAPSAITPAGHMHTDKGGAHDYPEPRALATDEIPAVIAQYVHAAERAIEAGFDGVEVHGANGYLIDQFLCTKSNSRTDAYGGSVENRIRFAVEVTTAVAAAIGVERTGIRLSPGHMFNDVSDDAPLVTAAALLDALPTTEMAYVHIMLADAFSPHLNCAGDPAQILPTLRPHVKGNLIAAGNLDKAQAEALLEAGTIQGAVFGRPFIANADLVARLKAGVELAEPKADLFYTPGPEGYTDYPTSHLVETDA